MREPSSGTLAPTRVKHASIFLGVFVIGLWGGGASAQTLGAGATERSLLERTWAEREFNLRLDEPLPRSASAASHTYLNYVRIGPVPAPDSLVVPDPALASPNRFEPGPSVVSPGLQLKDGQQRRTLELQARTRDTLRPEDTYRSQLQTQRSQFEREWRGQSLSDSILRDSARAMGR